MSTDGTELEQLTGKQPPAGVSPHIKRTQTLVQETLQALGGAERLRTIRSITIKQLLVNAASSKLKLELPCHSEDLYADLFVLAVGH
jgi:hypothetical protein